jgi:uncharacterized membrane protein HdeD (DUF308 family)
MSIQPEHYADMMRGLEKRAKRNLRQHWRIYVLEGLVVCAIGAAAVVVPQIASVAIDVFVGWLLVVVGVIGLVARLSSPFVAAAWPGVALAVVTIVLGAMLAFWPAQGVITLTMALTAYFIAHGLGMCALAMSIRIDTGRWFWLLFSALVDFVLAALVVTQWPTSADWLLGLYVGINLILGGLGLAFAALGAKASES